MNTTQVFEPAFRIISGPVNFSSRAPRAGNATLPPFASKVTGQRAKAFFASAASLVERIIPCRSPRIISVRLVEDRADSGNV